MVGTILRPRMPPSGFLGVHVGLPTDRSPNEFLVVRLGRDLRSGAAFAGERWFEARILPGEGRLLRRTSAHHCEDPGRGYPFGERGRSSIRGVLRPALADRRGGASGRSCPVRWTPTTSRVSSR